MPHRPKADALKILRNVRAAMGGAKATLMIGECALPDHDVVGVPPVIYQIDMQVTTRTLLPCRQCTTDLK